MEYGTMSTLTKSLSEIAATANEDGVTLLSLVIGIYYGKRMAAAFDLSQVNENTMRDTVLVFREQTAAEMSKVLSCLVEDCVFSYKYAFEVAKSVWVQTLRARIDPFANINPAEGSFLACLAGVTENEVNQERLLVTYSRQAFDIFSVLRQMDSLV